MASYYRLQQTVCEGPGTLMQEIFAAIAAAEQSMERERLAIVVLQRNFRKWICRSGYKRTLRYIMKIQRVYRGFKDRCRAMEKLLLKLETTNTHIFNHCAKTIQARIRGFLCRKKVADFYKQKAYLAAVEAKSQEVLQAAREHAATQQQIEDERRKEDTRKRFEATAVGLHHLLSTSCRHGVLKKFDAVDSQSTVFGGPIEEAIRAHKAPPRKFKRDLPPIAADTVETHDVFEAEKGVLQMTKMLDEKMRSSLHGPSNFRVRHAPPQHYVTSISQSTSYGMKIRWREEDKSKRIQPK